ncbi:MAG: YfcE family phosphodiesterase [Defluviitaleaceae bacterium]|nr:YfcE family phosphodiesterase [Defluviitaleaceae bacterium]
MRILVFSDSHGDMESIEKAMNRFYPDIAIHLGDGIEDLLNLSKNFPLSTFFYVRGDVDNFGDSHKKELFDNVSVYMTHHEYQFTIEQNPEKIIEVLKLDSQIVLFGNTHTPTLFVSNGITFMNPGSISKVNGFRTFGMIDVIDNEYLCKLMFADLIN